MQHLIISHLLVSLLMVRATFSHQILLYVLRTSILFEIKSSNHSRNLDNLKLLTNLMSIWLKVATYQKNVSGTLFYFG